MAKKVIPSHLGWQLPCLEPWMWAEPSVLCQGLSSPQHRRGGGGGGVLELGRCTQLRGCWGCWSEGLQPLVQGGGRVQAGAAEHSVVLPADCTAPAVLTWEGEISAVSQDAIQDTVLAQSETVIDEWDKQFDRGKVSPGCVLGGSRWEAVGDSVLSPQKPFCLCPGKED